MTARKHLSTQKVEKSKAPGLPCTFFTNLRPGLITGAANDDPSTIATYSVVGAAYGYAPLWTALVTFPIMAAVQLMCARLGSRRPKQISVLSETGEGKVFEERVGEASVFGFEILPLLSDRFCTQKPGWNIAY